MRASEVAYGATFAMGVPALLTVWAHFTARMVTLPTVASLPGGIALIAVGVSVILAGMLALRVYGRGLPMNAFPPPEYVTRGVYAYVRHPIYVGFAMAVYGVAIASGSTSGFWLVAPIATLGCVALVLGYERIDLRRRFGAAVDQPVRLRLPAASDAPPDLWDRLSMIALVLLPWLAMYEVRDAMGMPRDGVVTYLAVELAWPVLAWSEAIYAACYALVIVPPLIATRQRDLREYALSAWLATAIAGLMYATIPLIAPGRPFVAHTGLGDLLMYERVLDTSFRAFPSFHVTWALIGARLLAHRGRAWAIAAWTLAALITLSCVTTGQHSIADVLAGLALYLLTARPMALWERLRRSSERVANSWREWRIGPLRVISHAQYAGAALGLGQLVACGFAGPQHVLALATAGLACNIGAGLWGQFVEGSPRLLRPFGYYGGLVGAILATIAAPWLGSNVWLVLAAWATAGALMQGVGRLRCLVQGCCHGAPSPEWVGIKYTNARSRVLKIAGLGGVPFYPTQLYSMLANAVTFMILARLWFVHAPLSMIGGVYLIATGLGRFVEESYRGEPQTARVAGLHVYHWMAVASFLAGIAVTMLPSPDAQVSGTLSGAAFASALLLGASAAFSGSMDFPESHVRFSRLTQD